jgi:hypothetical protein
VNRRGGLVSILILTILAATPARAPGQATAHRTGWFDVTIGPARPLNGRYLFTLGPAIDANVAFQVRHTASHNPFVIVAAAAQGGFPSNDKCASDGHGGCLENLPSIKSADVLLGVDLLGNDGSRTGWSANLSAGPGISSVNGDDYGEHATVLSWHARIDLASSSARRGAIVASIRASLLPSAPLDVQGCAAGGLGFRVRF